MAIDPSTLNPRERMRMHSVDRRDNGILHGAALNAYNASNPTASAQAQSDPPPPPPEPEDDEE